VALWFLWDYVLLLNGRLFNNGDGTPSKALKRNRNGKAKQRIDPIGPEDNAIDDGEESVDETPLDPSLVETQFTPDQKSMIEHLAGRQFNAHHAGASSTSYSMFKE
jgi:hypothetical protein